ncbi:MAG: peptidylprolyl isomerase [Dehalococcoidales bacterium]|nr:peptidylprolyl isomerase [Dehalococcoidales bacterium]
MIKPNKKKRTSARSSDKAVDPITTRDQKGNRAGLIITVIVVAVMAAVLGIGYFQYYVAPFRRTVITVDDTAIRMDYFLKRASLSGAAPLSMLQALTNEQIIKLEAPQYGIVVTPEDIDREMRSLASGDNGTISEGEFREWYRQKLNETRLTDREYREITNINLLARGLQGHLAERIPTVAEQVHLYGILLPSYEDAEKTRARWEAGEEFADLARELSVDRTTKENGGEMGWLPRGIFRFDHIVFNLSPGEVSTPIPSQSAPSDDEPYYLFMVTEKAAAREIDEDSLQQMKLMVLDTWLPGAIQLHSVSYNFNSETDAWIKWQLSKMASK